MDMPEHLHALVDQLGQALVQALATDERSRGLAKRIQEQGYEVALMIEATVALRQLDLPKPSAPRPATPGPDPASPELAWSEEDKAFLRTFKISLD